MSRTVNQMSLLEIAFVQGFVQCDPAKFEAVVLGFFEQLSAREVERRVGIAKSTVARLVTEFRLVYGPWRDAMGDPAGDDTRLGLRLKTLVEDCFADEPDERVNRKTG